MISDTLIRIAKVVHDYVELLTWPIVALGSHYPLSEYYPFPLAGNQGKTDDFRCHR
jgi:hypothetical protein